MKIITITGGSLYTNCYMAYAEDSATCVLIDPGFDGEQILEKVRAQGKTVEAIFLTHGHFDHVGGVKEIVRQTGCKVYIHPADRELPSRLTLGTVPFTDSYGEGDQLQMAGLTFQVLHTPGHSPGSSCFLCAEEKVMFTGVTLFSDNIGRCDLWGGSYATIRQSLKSLRDYDGTITIYPGHGPSATLGTALDQLF